MSKVDVCVPTKNGDHYVLEKAIKTLVTSIENTDMKLNRCLILDSNVDLDRKEPVGKYAYDHGWPVRHLNYDMSLAQAREELIDRIETDWFVFLDDDVIVSEEYMSYLWEWTCSDRVGAVRGRKERHAARHPTSWLKQRVRRAGVHCLLVRTDAVESLAYPPDITGFYEDEYLRYHIEDRYRFIYEPRALFRHENQNRHPAGWEEGKLAGKYGYESFFMEALNVPYSLVKMRNPWPYTKRMFGWLYGRYAL